MSKFSTVANFATVQLEGFGSISHKQAVDKALEEYRKFQLNNLSPVEQAYLETIKQLERDVKK